MYFNRIRIFFFDGEEFLCKCFKCLFTECCCCQFLSNLIQTLQIFSIRKQQVSGFFHLYIQTLAVSNADLIDSIRHSQNQCVTAPNTSGSKHASNTSCSIKAVGQQDIRLNFIIKNLNGISADGNETCCFITSECTSSFELSTSDNQAIKKIKRLLILKNIIFLTNDTQGSIGISTNSCVHLGE